MDPQSVQPPVQPSIVPTPSSFVSSVPPSTPHKPSWMLWALGILGIAVISSAGTYLLLGSKSTQQPVATPTIAISPSLTPDPTANWKTYTNNELGFVFSYPNEFLYLYDNMNNVRERGTGQLLIQTYDGSKPSDLPDASKTQLYITVGKDLSLSLEQHVNDQQNFIKQDNPHITLAPPQKITIDGEQAFKGETIQKGEMVPTVWFKHKEFDYAITISPAPNNFQLLDQILSTFKFL